MAESNPAKRHMTRGDVNERFVASPRLKEEGSKGLSSLLGGGGGHGFQGDLVGANDLLKEQGFLQSVLLRTQPNRDRGGQILSRGTNGGHRIRHMRIVNGNTGIHGVKLTPRAAGFFVSFAPLIYFAYCIYRFRYIDKQKWNRKLK
jgi:hypothetical protein